ncbi:hypothetical protein OSB04_023697 [Centaurea solstitialis]|uniref:Uncharacterized protein n=1 Tax=Centaurea solstitialis TaxID=347529 RepID=A0AA38SJQ4_9ASTR|nr:hypothetical protein OSB04_023697 [Centaurea solstitialis]
MLELFAKDRATGTRAETAKERNKRSKESEKIVETIEEIDQLVETDDITLENFSLVMTLLMLHHLHPIHKLSFQVLQRDLCKVMESSCSRVYSEEEIFKELELIGNMSEEEISNAYLFLVASPEKARALFGCPLYMRMNMLRKMMGARE